MRTPLMHRLLAAATLASVCGLASAYPGLQLGILGASYNTSNESSIAPTPVFTLYAFLTPKGGESGSEITTLLADTYYVSAAMTPATSQAATLGSFKFTNGSTVSTVNATSDMVYGTPPLDALLSGGSGLATHGIFPTYFKEFSFQFSASDKVAPIDVQTNASLAGLNFAGTGAYYHQFQVDVGQLNSLLHFDLYNSEIRQCGSNQNPTPCDPVVYDLESQPYGFAPFSHDAQSSTTSASSSSTGGASGGSQIPEPASVPLAMLALGLLGWQYNRRGKPAKA